MNTTQPEHRKATDAVSEVLRQQHLKRRWAWVQVATIVLVALSVVAIAVFAISNHPHRATLGLVALLYFLAFLRAVWPGRPWFASRHRWMDVVLYVVLGSAIWFLSPFTAMMLNSGS